MACGGLNSLIFVPARGAVQSPQVSARYAVTRRSTARAKSRSRQNTAAVDLVRGVMPGTRRSCARRSHSRRSRAARRRSPRPRCRALACSGPGPRRRAHGVPVQILTGPAARAGDAPHREASNLRLGDMAVDPHVARFAGTSPTRTTGSPTFSTGTSRATSRSPTASGTSSVTFRVSPPSAEHLRGFGC